jgi:hypothetical protein
MSAPFLLLVTRCQLAAAPSSDSEYQTERFESSPCFGGRTVREASTPPDELQRQRLGNGGHENVLTCLLCT